MNKCMTTQSVMSILCVVAGSVRKMPGLLTPAPPHFPATHKSPPQHIAATLAQPLPQSLALTGCREYIESLT